ncbi:MAG: nucleotidyltransferase domain-containing protein [Lachnospiraceae bacterium]|nr:nucleotidyltransferase domain-containing protein [Lachnospiraceae bacterium]
MTPKTYTIEELKSIVSPIAEKYQISRVYLFGSFARGDYDEQSDIDIRIEKGNLKGMFALCGFYTEVSEALERKVDILTTGSLSEEFLESIKKDEILLYKSQQEIG